MMNKHGKPVAGIFRRHPSGPGLPIHRPVRRGSIAVISMLLCLLSASIHAARLPGDWQYFQSVRVEGTGLLRMSIPIGTLDAGRPGLEDLRLYDSSGSEVPFRIERPAPAAKGFENGRNFLVRIEERSTVATFETDQRRPIDRVTLTTPARDFIKAATLEGSGDGVTWRMIVQAQPIFRQRDGAMRLHLEFPADTYAHMRVTLDDSRTGPIPVTGVQVRTADLDPVPAEPIDIRIVEREESSDQTRLTIEAAGAHIVLADIEFEVTDPLFTREVSLGFREHKESEVSESTLARGTIYRAAIEGQPAVSSLTFAVDATIPVRELILTIQNGDSPPLVVTGMRASRRPVYISWLAKEPGAVQLLSGNPNCAAPRYDLTTLPPNVTATLVTPSEIDSLAPNPDWRAGEALAGIQEVGTTIDLSKWTYRKRIEISKTGVQQVELDLETLSRAAPGFQDLRLIRNGKQVPYLIERTPITRSLAPAIERADDPKRPTVSRWIIRFPNPSLPVTRLTCDTDAPFFKREVRLTEDVPDDRGNPRTVIRGTASWVRTPGEKMRKLALQTASPVTDSLILHVENGDNPPLDLKDFRSYYLATRVIFDSSMHGDTFLYYGNRSAALPRYDIDLIAPQLLAAKKVKATLVKAEPLKKTAWAEGESLTGKGGWVLWIALGALVVVLLGAMARLLPKKQ